MGGAFGGSAYATIAWAGSGAVSVTSDFSLLYDVYQWQADASAALAYELTNFCDKGGAFYYDAFNFCAGTDSFLYDLFGIVVRNHSLSYHVTVFQPDATVTIPYDLADFVLSDAHAAASFDVLTFIPDISTQFPSELTAFLPDTGFVYSYDMAVFQSADVAVLYDLTNFVSCVAPQISFDIVSYATAVSCTFLYDAIAFTQSDAYLVWYDVRNYVLGAKTYIVDIGNFVDFYVPLSYNVFSYSEVQRRFFWGPSLRRRRYANHIVRH